MSEKTLFNLLTSRWAYEHSFSDDGESLYAIEGCESLFYNDGEPVLSGTVYCGWTFTNWNSWEVKAFDPVEKKLHGFVISAYDK